MPNVEKMPRGSIEQRFQKTQKTNISLGQYLNRTTFPKDNVSERQRFRKSISRQGSISPGQHFARATKSLAILADIKPTFIG
jgi:hypothetical protein